MPILTPPTPPANSQPQSPVTTLDEPQPNKINEQTNANSLLIKLNGSQESLNKENIDSLSNSKPFIVEKRINSDEQVIESIERRVSKLIDDNDQIAKAKVNCETISLKKELCNGHFHPKEDLNGFSEHKEDYPTSPRLTNGHCDPNETNNLKSNMDQAMSKKRKHSINDSSCPVTHNEHISNGFNEEEHQVAKKQCNYNELSTHATHDENRTIQSLSQNHSYPQTFINQQQQQQQQSNSGDFVCEWNNCKR